MGRTASNILLLAALAGTLSPCAYAQAQESSKDQSNVQSNAEDKAGLTLQYKVFKAGARSREEPTPRIAVPAGTPALPAGPSADSGTAEDTTKSEGGSSASKTHDETSSQTSAVSEATGNRSGKRIRLAQVMHPLPPSQPQYLLQSLYQERGGRRPAGILQGTFGTIMNRVLAPFTSPVSNGLEDTATGLTGTALQMHQLQKPLNNLVAPIGDLSEPLRGIAAPLNSLGEPIGNLKQPLQDLRAPIMDLTQPIGKLNEPVAELGKSTTALHAPINDLAKDVDELRQPLTGLSQPLSEMRGPLQELPKPLTALVPPIAGLQQPLRALQQPINGLSGSVNALNVEMHDLRQQIAGLQRALEDAGRNVTLAIVFGACVIAWAIWTQRKVPAASLPTITTVESVSDGGAKAGTPADAQKKTILITQPATTEDLQLHGAHPEVEIFNSTIASVPHVSPHSVPHEK